MNTATGLPAIARQNPYLYLFILLIIIGCLIFIAFYFLQKHFRNIRTSPEWIKANSMRTTNFRDVKRFSKTAELTAQERDFLWKLCRDHRARNIEYLSRNTEEVNELFSSEYQDLKILENLQDRIQILFSIRYKIEKLRERQLQIKSTRSLHPGQVLTYCDNEDRIWNFVLRENTHDTMKLELPAGFASSPIKPEAFKKISLSLSPSPGRTYKIQTRTVRYEKDGNMNDILVTTASDLLQPMLKRASKRLPLNESNECIFQAVHQKQDGKKTVLEVQEKKYRGMLLDISATGCSIKCGLPIKKDQYIKVTAAVGSSPEIEATGRIVVTNRVRDKEEFVLHIQFIKIDLAAQNLINAFIYGYEALGTPS